MAVPSYDSGTKSFGIVRILKDFDQDVNRHHILVAEDIIDSGLTLSWLRVNLLSRGTASVRIATALRKPTAARVEAEVIYVGSKIPSELTIGCRFDYAEKYHSLPSVGTLAPHVYED